MSKKGLSIFVLSLLVLSSVLTACAPTEEAPDLSGVTVTFWHVYGSEGAHAEKMNELIDRFNETNEWDITVEGMDQGQYNDIADKFNAGIQSGDLPNIVMGYTNTIADWYSAGAIADLNPYIEDANIGLTDEEIDAMYDAAWESGIAPDGAHIMYPLTQSGNVLIYNYTWAEELGFSGAPKTSAELKEQLCTAAAYNDELGGDFAGTGGLVYYPSTSNWMHFLFAFGGTGLNEAGDAYDFNTDAAVEASMFLNDLRDEGCLFQTESYPNPEQAQRKALITMSSTAGIPYYLPAFEEEGNLDVWGPIALPGPDGTLAVDAFQQMLGVVDATEAEEQAAWLFIKWLTSPEIQAEWVVVSGYYPTQSTTEPLISDYLAENEIYAAGLELIQMGPAEPQAFTAWSSVRSEVGTAAAELFNAQSEEEVRAILEEFNATCAELVEEVQ